MRHNYFLKSFIKAWSCTYIPTSWRFPVVFVFHQLSANLSIKGTQRIYNNMEAAFLSTPEEALQNFHVTEQSGLNGPQVQDALKKYGRNGTIQYYNPIIQQELH